MSLLDGFKNMPNEKEIKGGFGEYLAKYYSKLITDGLIIHDVLINGEKGYTSQIDLVIVGQKGLYVVEVKFFEDARVYGDGKKSTWYYYRSGKKYEIYSPLKQNKKHVQYLKEFMKIFGDVPCFSVLAILCDEVKAQNINENSENPDTVVITGLLSLKEAIAKIAKNKPVVFDENKKQEIFNYIINNQHKGKDIRQQHKENVKAYKNSTHELKNQKMCPCCKAELVLRKGKYGEFYGCTNYPRCKITLNPDK